MVEWDIDCMVLCTDVPPWIVKFDKDKPDLEMFVNVWKAKACGGVSNLSHKHSYQFSQHVAKLQKVFPHRWQVNLVSHQNLKKTLDPVAHTNTSCHGLGCLH